MYSYWNKKSKQDFELNVISHHPDFEGRSLKKYSADGIDTFGVFADEAFQINFSNNSNEDVQVKLSLDGIDILTGKPADLEINHKMWLVRAGNTLHLKAWPETQNGGAKFVFTSAENSVALHTSGDISHKGIISAAVFTEKYKRMMSDNYRYDSYSKGGQQVNSTDKRLGSRRRSSEAPISCAAGVSPDSLNKNYSRDLSEEVKSSASIGAGEYVEQKTKTVKGLDSPELNSIVRVRYLWWDELKSKLNENKNNDHPTGFPAEKIKSFADLSGVPRVSSAGSVKNIFEPEKVSKGFERFV